MGLGTTAPEPDGSCRGCIDSRRLSTVGMTFASANKRGLEGMGTMDNKEFEGLKRLDKQNKLKRLERLENDETLGNLRDDLLEVSLGISTTVLDSMTEVLLEPSTTEIVIPIIGGSEVADVEGVEASEVEVESPREMVMPIRGG